MRRRKRPSATDPRIQAAFEELKGLIAAKFPQATFEVCEGDDNDGEEVVTLDVTVDVGDRFDVYDLYSDRLVDMQIEEGLPIWVSVDRPLPEASAAGRD